MSLFTTHTTPWTSNAFFPLPPSPILIPYTINAWLLVSFFPPKAFLSCFLPLFIIHLFTLCAVFATYLLFTLILPFSLDSPLIPPAATEVGGAVARVVLVVVPVGGSEGPPVVVAEGIRCVAGELAQVQRVERSFVAHSERTVVRQTISVIAEEKFV